MKSINLHRWLKIVGMMLLLVLAAPTSVYAHEGEAGIDLGQNLLTPGSVLKIEGFNLGADVTVTIVLEKDSRRIPIGQIIADDHGDFLADFPLPQDLPVGLYTVTAIDQRIPGSEKFLATATLRVEEPRSNAWLTTIALPVSVVLGLVLLAVVYFNKKAKTV